eukprot:CAMPEP_0203918814 /NCGR_PEP_ID=MMETSP0359-20131031/59311_1 /ASSEMBLY_ACC=CAM_ASM_000338 /TAXON_ID=268821 /ORGANISM="Scrippsiella Hangoei, Strain SHTV-5" /LENGTH=286 /DNA_ID=CAMNT_0050845983 /DNA_START=63 /DNA_END=920 /DNA_ORIENTATION=+
MGRKQVLRLLQTYRRSSAPSAEELAELEVRAAKLAEMRLPSAPQEDIAETHRLVSQRLPWHRLAMASSPEALWSVLASELTSSQGVEDLLPLCVPLGLGQDDFYVRALGCCGGTAGGEAKTKHMEDLLLCIQDFRKAWDAATALEERAPLGPEKVAIAKVRLQLLKNRTQGSPLWGNDVDSELRVMLEGIEQHVATMETRWDLARTGLSIFDEVLTRGDPRACIACMYYHFPMLLYWPDGEPLSPDSDATCEADALLRSARAMGVWGLHSLVDVVCARHGISTKQL